MQNPYVNSDGSINNNNVISESFICKCNRCITIMTTTDDLSLSLDNIREHCCICDGCSSTRWTTYNYPNDIFIHRNPHYNCLCNIHDLLHNVCQ